MGSISKHCLNSSTSNEETDHHHRPEKFKGENHGGVGRFYECNFCKRGFTNAQALGGHMNIHRKDKDRAGKSNNNNNNNKMKKKTSKNSKFSISKYGGDDDHDEEECKNCSSVHIRYQDHQIMDCFQFINYSSKLGFDYYSDQSNDSTVNLSIQIDQHYNNIQEDTYEGRENELDLELRLG